MDRLAIDGNPADEQWRHKLVAVVIVNNHHTIARWKYVDVINRRHSNRPAIGQMNGEWHERLGGNQPADISNHRTYSTVGRVLPQRLTNSLAHYSHPGRNNSSKLLFFGDHQIPQ